MRKRTPFLALIILFLVGLTACGGQAATAVPPAPTHTAQPAPPQSQ